MDANFQEKIEDYNISSNNHEDLLNWINSLEMPISKKYNNIEDIKNADTFLELLKYYFQLKNQKYYLSLLNLKTINKQGNEKLKFILHIISQLIYNNEINLRIDILKKNINNFFDNEEMVWELLTYVKYLYEKNIYNGHKMYNNDNKNNSNIIYNNNKFPITSFSKNTFKEIAKRKNQKKLLLKDFYNYNKYKRIIINDLINKNYECKSTKALNPKVLNNNMTDNLNIKNNNTYLNNLKTENDKFENKNLRISSDLEINTFSHNYINKPKSLKRNLCSFYSVKNLNCFKNPNSNIKNKKEIEFNSNNNSNYNTYDNAINITDINNNLEDKKINNKKINEKIVFTENNMSKSFNSISSILPNRSFSKNLKNDISSYNYKPNTKKFSSNINIISIIRDKEKEIKIMDKKMQMNNNKYQNNLIGMFQNDKMKSSEDEEDLNIYKIPKLTNPLVLYENNLKKIKPTPPRIKQKLTEKNSSIKNSSIYANSNYINNISNHIDNDNYFSFKNANNIIKENNEKSNSKYTEIKNLIDNIEPIQKRFLTRQNSFLYENKELNNIINDNRKEIKPKKQIVYHSKSTINRQNNLYNYNNINKNMFIDKKDQKYNINIYNIKTENMTKEKIDKKEIIEWLKDINIIKNTDFNAILISEYVSDGIILCDIINECENDNNKIKGIFRPIASKEEALKNINKALDFLKKKENFPKRNISDYELIFEIDDQTIWGLLNDLYKYYSKKMGYTKNKEIIDVSNSSNQINNLLNEKNYYQLSRNNKKIKDKEKLILNISDLNDFKNRTINKYQNHFDTHLNINRLNIRRNYSNILNISNINNNNNLFKNNFFKNIMNVNDDDINFRKNACSVKNSTLAQQRNLSAQYERKEFINKGYFDYVNDLKSHFDKNKLIPKKGNEIIDNKQSYIFNSNDDNDNQLLNIKNKLYFNYNNYKNYNNKNKKNASPSIRTKYNYTEYYNN